MPAADEPGRRALPSDLARLLHDLRGPLNSLAVHTQLLTRSVGDDAVAEASARAVLGELARLSGMLTEAFAVAALELGAVGQVDLGAVVEAARCDAAATVTVAAGTWPSVLGDAALLRAAVAHLLRNAVEAAMVAPRPPLVSATVEGEQTVVSVRDWGPGFHTTDPKLVIRPWHSTKPDHRGLGLVTVERIARLHGGTVRFESTGDGALVSLLLPRAR
ncbi:MAG TPA: HAMP domain-containing sensor histidine kinase [Methylomirabilota bacterium]|nr:HAMP domain-containing sensor histidine kinase [Methylomirabilota bacterium]